MANCVETMQVWPHPEKTLAIETPIATAAPMAAPIGPASESAPAAPYAAPVPAQLPPFPPPLESPPPKTFARLETIWPADAAALPAVEAT